MKNTYSKNPLLVKQERAALRHRYPLLCGFRNFLFNALPFALIWLVSSINMLAAALAAFFMMLLHCLMENRRENRRLSQMVREVKERGNA